MGSIIFKVVGANETLKDLLDVEFKVISKAKSATGSTIFELKNKTGDFTFEEKQVDFSPEAAYLNGFLSDGGKNVGVAQLKFLPFTIGPSEVKEQTK